MMRRDKLFVTGVAIPIVILCLQLTIVLVNAFQTPKDHNSFAAGSEILQPEAEDMQQFVRGDTLEIVLRAAGLAVEAEVRRAVERDQPAPRGVVGAGIDPGLAAVADAVQPLLRARGRVARPGGDSQFR